jgi:hypothetical protein
MSMYQLQRYIGYEIFWESASFFGSTYQLVAANQVLATLAFDFWGNSAIATAPEGAFSIERQGIFNHRYHVYYAGQECAVYTPDWLSSGTLQFMTGKTFYWRSIGFLSGEMAWRDTSDYPFMRFRSSFWGAKYYITIEPQTGNIAELSLLAIMGRYL